MAQPAYQYPPPPVVTTPVVRARTSGLVVRIVLTLLGAAGMVISGILKWIDGITGVRLSVRALSSTRIVDTSNFVTTVGFIVIVLGLLAIVGLAPTSGWLTRLAGALGIVVFVVFTVELYRTSGRQFPDPGVWAGAWLSLASSLVALIAGFFGTRAAIVRASQPTLVA
jgi:hypothetical protein